MIVRYNEKGQFDQSYDCLKQTIRSASTRRNVRHSPTNRRAPWRGADVIKYT